jgi:hypothetical protein
MKGSKVTEVNYSQQGTRERKVAVFNIIVQL